MSPRHSKHDSRHRFKPAPAPRQPVDKIVLGVHPAEQNNKSTDNKTIQELGNNVFPDGGDNSHAMEEVWPGGFRLDENAEDQIRRLRDTTTIQRGKKNNPLPPNMIDLGEDYEVLALLGQGGMGYVYQVKDKRKNQLVAVKVVRPELATDERALKRFAQEAEAAMGLIHPNLVPVYAQGVTADGAPYLVMEYQEGTPLDKILKQEKCIDADRAVDIFMQICDALEHAHAKGIVHRDLKPSNIVLTKGRGNKDQVRIVDFGIAKVLAGPESRETFDLTHTGDLFGSPNYMSPEQCMGYRLDARSDVYSLGCVMYEVLSGQPPFVSDNPVQTIVKHLSESPQRLVGMQNERKEVPGNLESLVMRCLEKDPRNRYQTMEQLRKDLANIQTGEMPVYYTRAREATSHSLPFVAAVAAMLIFNLFCLSAAFEQHEQAVQTLAVARAIVERCDKLESLYDEAIEDLGGYNMSRSPIFADRVERVMSQMLSEETGLSNYNTDNPVYQSNVQRVSLVLSEGIKAISFNKQCLDQQINEPKGESATDRIGSAGHIYAQAVRTSRLELRDQLKPISKEALATIESNPLRTSKMWIELEVLALMIVNMLLILGPGKKLALNTKQRLWQNNQGEF